MADFERALKILSVFEGGYTNDPDDEGGETYRGIARNFNPNWMGWRLIDGNRHSAPPEVFAEWANKNEILIQMAKAFYKFEYWDKIRGDEIGFQGLATEMLECGVLTGIHQPITFLQKSLNMLNRNGELFTDLMADGVFGPRTLSALCMLPPKDHQTLLVLMNHYQRQHLLDCCERKPIKEKYIRGWLERTKV